MKKSRKILIAVFCTLVAIATGLAVVVAVKNKDNNDSSYSVLDTNHSETEDSVSDNSSQPDSSYITDSSNSISDSKEDSSEITSSNADSSSEAEKNPLEGLTEGVDYDISVVDGVEYYLIKANEYEYVYDGSIPVDAYNVWEVPEEEKLETIIFNYTAVPDYDKFMIDELEEKTTAYLADRLTVDSSDGVFDKDFLIGVEETKEDVLSSYGKNIGNFEFVEKVVYDYEFEDAVTCHVSFIALQICCDKNTQTSYPAYTGGYVGFKRIKGEWEMSYINCDICDSALRKGLFRDEETDVIYYYHRDLYDLENRRPVEEAE